MTLYHIKHMSYNYTCYIIIHFDELLFYNIKYSSKNDGVWNVAKIPGPGF